MSVQWPWGLQGHAASAKSLAVLLVADLFHPLDHFAVELFLNGDMRHTGGCRGSMPVFLTRRDPDNITLPDFLNWTAPLLNPACASGHDQNLAQRVGMPCCPSAGLERDPRAGRACRILRLEQGIDAYGTSEVFG